MYKKVVLVDRFGSIEYSFAGRKYISNELEVNKCLLQCTQVVVQFLLAFEVVPYFTKEWQTKLRTELEMIWQAHHVYNAICVKCHPHMARAPVFFAPIVLLPAQVLYMGVDDNFVASSEDALDEGRNWPVPDEV